MIGDALAPQFFLFQKIPLWIKQIHFSPIKRLIESKKEASQKSSD